MKSCFVLTLRDLSDYTGDGLTDSELSSIDTPYERDEYINKWDNLPED